MSSVDPRRSGNPAVRATVGGSSSPAGDLSGTRGVVSERSRAVLLRLSRLPRLTIPLAVLFLMVVGLSAPLIAALPAFALLAAFVGWLAYLSWPALDTRARLVRGFVLAVVVGSAVAQIGGWL